MWNQPGIALRCQTGQRPRHSAQVGPPGANRRAMPVGVRRTAVQERLWPPEGCRIFIVADRIDMAAGRRRKGSDHQSCVPPHGCVHVDVMPILVEPVAITDISMIIDRGMPGIVEDTGDG
jgi:hypothetical protein